MINFNNNNNNNLNTIQIILVTLIIIIIKAYFNLNNLTIIIPNQTNQFKIFIKLIIILNPFNIENKYII